MEINLNTNKMPLMPAELPRAAATASAREGSRPAMTISTSEFSSITGSEVVDAATEADVATRDDALGKLFQRAFNYQPPPMPNFL